MWQTIVFHMGKREVRICCSGFWLLNPVTVMSKFQVNATIMFTVSQCSEAAGVCWFVNLCSGVLRKCVYIVPETGSRNLEISHYNQ